MECFKLMLLFLSVNAAVYKTTHAEIVGVKNNHTSDTKNKEIGSIIELNKDVTVNTGFNLDIALAQLNNTEASNIPKIRKVTPVDNDSLERKTVNATERKNEITTTVIPSQGNTILTEAGVIEIKATTKNFTDSALNAKKSENKTTSNQSSINIKSNATLTNNTDVVIKHEKNSNQVNITTKPPPYVNTTAKPIHSTEIKLTTTNSTITLVTSSNAKENIISNSSTTGSTINTSTTSTTTTTTTPKPKKPTITYSVQDFPDLEKDNPELKNLLQLSASNKLPIPDIPYAQPSQEFSSNFHRGRDFILPIVSMIFIIPLVIGIIITSYRRFRDCWSTRHYRRMDFLVDGMYND